ncbi:Tyrosine aminotransferase [Plasmodiophora brassicae]|uniref:Tyrosine aminotransferase n=1 Tax=Plasmodiophora brassicae TaxID=37360 RepID=A0A0G4J1K6_PLABS|nr:hypothetical protein PBRA_008516 [Plasmodiophora brassicae]
MSVHRPTVPCAHHSAGRWRAAPLPPRNRYGAQVDLLESSTGSAGVASMAGSDRAAMPDAAAAAASPSDHWAPVPASAQAQRTYNPIRAVVDKLRVDGNPDLPLIPLSIGDPSTFGNLPPSPVACESLRAVLDAGRHHGYPPSIGYADARAAVASWHNTPESPLTANDVVLASGGSGAIDLCMTALLNPGDSLLIPQPGFSLYTTLALSYGYVPRYYDLRPDQHWQADLDHAASLVDATTRVLIVNNPSNPCGTVYSRDHLVELLEFAQRHRLVVIADEIYGRIVFGTGAQFHPMGPLSRYTPVLTVGGLAKEFLVPGWRLGWILIHDRHQQLRHIRPAITQLSQMILGPNSLVQAALPALFGSVPDAYFADLCRVLRDNAERCVRHIDRIEGLSCVAPQGAMYLMVRIDLGAFAGFQNDMDFSQALLTEQSVFVLPGTAFRAPGFFRIVYCAPGPALDEAFDRIRAFCRRHHRGATTT